MKLESGDFDAAHAQLTAFLKKYPDHARVQDARADLGYLLREKARATRDDKRARALLEEGEAMFSGRGMLDQFNLGLMLWAAVQRLDDRKKLDRMIKVYDAFGWKWDQVPQYYVVSVHLALAYREAK